MEPLRVINTQPPALMAGENSEVFRDSQQRVVMYHVGRNLTYTRPELYLPAIRPGQDFRDMLFGLCLVYNRSLQHNGDPNAVEGWANNFEKLPPGALKALQPYAMAAYPELVKEQPLLEYLAAVEHTAARGGLIASGDLAAAVKGINEGGDGALQLDTRTRVKELVMFSVSKAHLDVRKAIGAALTQQKQQ